MNFADFFRFVKIAVFVPETHVDLLRQAMAEAGAGSMGKYEHASFSVKGTGRFRGSAASKPFVGEAGRLETVEEERVESICPIGKVDAVLQAIKRAHPYEEPAVDVYPLLNNGQL